MMKPLPAHDVLEGVLDALGRLVEILDRSAEYLGTDEDDMKASKVQDFAEVIDDAADDMRDAWGSALRRIRRHVAAMVELERELDERDTEARLVDTAYREASAILQRHIHARLAANRKASAV